MPRFAPSGRARSRTVAGLATAALLLAGGAACSSSDGPDQALADFMAGWRNSNLDKVGLITPDGAKVGAQQVTDQIKQLTGGLKTPPELAAQGKPKAKGDLATGSIAVRWPLPGGAAWSYQSHVQLSKGSQGWRVIWAPTIVHEQLSTGDKLALRKLTAKRAGVLDGAGKPLVTPTPTVVVGVSPQKITGLSKLIKDLTAAFASIKAPVSLADLPGRVAKADPGAFVDVVTLREPDYLKIKDRIQPLPGTVFRKETRDLAPSRVFARALLGTADQAQLDDLKAHPELDASDVVGHGGLQQRYDARLRGAVGQAVTITRAAPDGKVTDTELFRTEPTAGAPVKTTLDQAIQTAADKALAAEKRPSALVALRVSDAAVLATANGPNGGGDNLAFTAQVPPGSTMKVISALGLLQSGGATLDGPVDCPKTATVEGHKFRNSHDMELGKVAFRTIFAKSCNTGFVSLAPKLGADGLAKAAAQVGVGAQWDLGVDAFSGQVPTGGSATDQAAAVFGQGKTLVSPLAMAGAAAAVARGEFHQPQVLLDPAPAKPAAPGTALPAAAVEPLRTMMREVVTKGTGTSLADVPGKPVYGKTGTAEFETGSTDTHAWFVGWQGDVAFAAFVQQGGAGADAAAPIVERFLRELA